MRSILEMLFAPHSPSDKRETILCFIVFTACSPQMIIARLRNIAILQPQTPFINSYGTSELCAGSIPAGSKPRGNRT
jgi:hypothetical protein